MNPTDLWPALVAAGLALMTSQRVAGRWPLHTDGARHRSIDGLRGYLALGVFLHHATVWQGYRSTGVWASSDSAFYTNAGKGSVALFFMITAFLFYGRLLEARERPIDWTRLFLGRWFRLTPAYLVMLALLLVMVGVQTGGQWRVSGADLLRQIGDWLLFTFPGPSDINGLRGTQMMVAGVTWSLPYEWMLYAALPLLALLAGRRPSPGALGVTAVSCIAFVCWRPSLGSLVPFAVGMLAAYAARWPRLQRGSGSRYGSVAVLLSLIGGFALDMRALSPLPQVFQALAFVLIAAGNDLFGVLSAKVSRTFGEPTYSLYLLHGVVLFIGFRWVIGPAAAGLSSSQHWVAIWLMTPVAVALSHLCHRFVEMPGMALTDRCLRRWRGTAASPAGAVPGG
jgi:peptidoglycan/LPS O-acetylase OafA/YrhL